MANRIQLRRDGAQQWANVNPILAQGELGIEIDTSRLKIGDGVTAWNSLRYERPLETESNTANTLVKRDADGNFEAGAITASLVGNSATATRLANARNIALGGDMSGSGTFDGSSNLTITAELNYVPTLPHYDSNDLAATGTYSQVTIDSRGRITQASNPTTLSAYGIADAQPLDTDLTSLAAITTFGLLSRQAEGTIVSRTITGGSNRIIVQNGTGQTNNPFIDLADTTVVVGTYNPVGNLDTPLISATTGDETVNTTNLTVDRYGRLTYAQTSAIATAKQGSEVAAYNAGTTYVRYDKVQNAAGKLYQALLPIGAGAGEPTHTDTSDAGSWRYLSSAVAPQKGLASFNQEDFDVTAWDAGNNYEGGFVTIAAAGVDNTQLQNNRIGFADGNTVENFELDQELTATTGYRGFNYLNYTKVNDTTGNLLVGANNQGNGSSGNQQAIQNVAVTVGTDTVGGQATGVFYLDGVETPTGFSLKKGIKYIFNQDESTNATFNGMDHPLMVSPTTDGEHNGGDHYMMGITYKLDGAVVNMAGYVSGFVAATTRRMEWLVQEEAPATLYYWCHHHTGQGDSFTVTEGGAGEFDINVRSYFSHPDITLDGAITQTIDKTGDGHLNFQLTQNTASDRNLSILSTNAGAGNATILIQSENDITIAASNVANRVHVEDYWLQDNVLSTTNATMILDPNDDDDVTGLVQIRGDLQVDGTTTTVNSTVVTIDDPIFTLGGDTAPVADDNKDRGIEFKYYDTQARLGFFGWDEDYADSNIWSSTGGFRFLYNATNTSEVFTGTDAPIIAGNLRLTTNTDSTSTTTGTLVVTGGLGLSANAHIGGEVTIAGQTEINDTVLIKSDNEDFKIQTAAGVDKFTVDTDTGNTVIEGTVDIQLETEITDNLIIKADNKKFDIQTAAGVSVFDVDTDNGNTHTDGTLDVDSGVTFNSTLDVDNNVTLNAELDVDGDVVFHNDFLMDVTGKTFTITNGSAQKFQITSTNGNTDIEGTLNVNSLSTFEKTTNITVDTSADDAITQTATGAVDIDGGANVDADLRVGGDLYVSDRIDSKDAGTARTRPSLLNNLDVRYREYIGSVAAHNADFANDPDANLRVAGGAGIVADLYVGDDFYVGKVSTTDNVEFSILGESGFTTIGRVGQGGVTDGAIVVHGDATFNREVNITGSLTTIGNANTDVLTVNAVSQFTDDVTVDGSLTVNTNALIEGNLTVNGTTTTVNSTVVTVDDPVFTLGGDTAPGSDDAKDRGIEFRYYDTQARLGFFGWDNSASRYALYHAATNTSEAFGGTRSGLDAGSIKLFDTTDSTTASTGTLIVGGGAGIGLNLFVGANLDVATNTDIGGNLNVVGDFDLTDDLRINTSKFTVDSQTGNTYAEGTLQVDGNVTLGNAGSDAHSVTGTVQFNQAITSTDITADQIQIGVDAANEISTTSGNLILDSDGGTVNVTDDLDVDLNLNVDGNTKIDGTLTVDGNATIGNASGDNHIVTGTVTFNQAITSTNITADSVTIGVDSDGEISTTTGVNLILDSATGETQVDDNLTVTGTLDVDGNTQIGNASGDAHAFTGTVTFNQAITSTDITADNIQIGVSGASEVDTSSGNLTLDSATGETIVDDNFTVVGTADIGGLTTITDGVTVKADNKLVQIQTAAGLTKVSIDTDNGNTDIQGTLNVEGATTIDDTLNVTQAVDLDTTLNVDGVATFQNNVILNADNKNFKIQLDNGTDKFTVASASGNTDIQGTLDVNGATNVTNTVGITGITSVTNATNPANLIGAAALQVTGGAVINKDVFFGEDFYMGPNNAPTLSVVGASGNTLIAGTLGVTGTTTLGIADVGTLNLSSNANISGSIIVNTSKFIVAGASGNTTIDGTLDVAGSTTIDDTLNVTQNVDFDSDLNVDGNQQLDGTLTVNSTSLLKDSVVLRGGSKTLKLQNGSSTDKITLHSTSGNAEITGTATLGTLDVTNNSTIGGTLGVTGQITGDVTGDLTGNADTASLVNVTETATSNLTYYPTFVSANTGNTEVRTDSGNLTYNPSTNTLTVNNFKSTTDFEVQGNLNVTGALTFFQSQVGSIANHDTGDLTEGTNLYYTNERVDDRVNNLINGGTGITATYDDAGNMLTLSATQSDINTDNITEGSTNLFTTAARTRTHFSYGTGIQLDTGTLSVTQADIDTDNVTEGSTNLFYTAARGRASFSATGSLAYNASTGVFSYTTPTTIASLSNHDTDDVAEGSSNKYYTDERVDDRVNALIIAGTGVTKVYDDGANTYTLSVTQADVNTDTVTEGSTNLFTTAARTRTHFTYGTGITHSGGTLSVTQSDIDTDNVTEGSTNLFTTAARTRGHISVSGDLAYNSGTGVISFTQRTDAGVNTLADARIAAADTDDLSEGSTNLYYTNARADARIAAADTDDLSEGSSNLYHTTARARASISAGGDLAYNSSTGVMSVTLPTVFSGDYDDLSNKPTLGTAAATATTAYATAAQGTTADNALAASAVSTFGGTLIDDADAGAARTTLGLGTAAITNATAYATAAQGATADSALQAETITLATLKSVTAASADFADFQTRIAAL